MRLTLEEARGLYKQGSLAREIALREYTEEEIINDYTKVISLPNKTDYTDTINLFAGLYTAYMQMSKGRIPNLTRYKVYIPDILISHPDFHTRTANTFMGEIKIDDKTYKVYAGCRYAIWEGKLAYENDGVPCGNGVTANKWVFKEKEQAAHFAKHFWKELILLELQDLWKVEFPND